MAKKETYWWPELVPIHDPRSSKYTGERVRHSLPVYIFPYDTLWRGA